MKQGDYVVYCVQGEILVGKVGSFDAFKQKARVIPVNNYTHPVVLRKKKLLTPVEVFMKKYGKYMKGE